MAICGRTDPLSPRTMTLRRVRLRDVDMGARWRSRSGPLALALLSSSSREAHEEFGGSGREIQRSTRRCWRWSDGFDFLLAFLLERLARRCRAITCSLVIGTKVGNIFCEILGYRLIYKKTLVYYYLECRGRGLIVMILRAFFLQSFECEYIFRKFRVFL